MQGLRESSILSSSTKFLFRSSKHGVGGGLLILEAWFDSKDRSLFDGILIIVGMLPRSVTAARESPKFLVAVQIRAG